MGISKILTIIIFFLFIILYQYHQYEKYTIIPIIKQVNEYANNKMDNIMARINDRPEYGNIPPEYTGTAYAGENSMKGDIVHEQIIEQTCPVGSYIKNLEIGSSDDFINYIKGSCSNGQELDMLGKELNKSTKKNINDEYGFNGVNIKYDSSYLNEISQVGEKRDAGKKIQCLPDHIIVGYRGRAENPNHDDIEDTDFRVKHVQFICNDQNAEKNIPRTHMKCGDDGDVCKFNRNNEYIYYGVPGRKVVKINKKKIKSNSFTCYPSGFFPKKGADILPIEDPLPGVDKSCYTEKSDYDVDYKALANTMAYRLWGAWSNDKYFD